MRRFTLTSVLSLKGEEANPFSLRGKVRMGVRGLHYYPTKLLRNMNPPIYFLEIEINYPRSSWYRFIVASVGG